MATTLATITGDISDFVDVDFTTATARIRANTPFIVDPDHDKIRLASAAVPVASNGTFTFANVVAGASTVVPGTLQYYVDIAYRHGSTVIGDGEITLGPFVLAAGTQDLSDLEAQQPTTFDRSIPFDIDVDVLAAAQDYTDDQLDAHEASADPHTQYVQAVNTSGVVVHMPIVHALEGEAFPPVIPGALLIYGGF